MANKTLMAAMVAAALAVPLAVNAGGDKDKKAEQGAGQPSAAASQSKADGGAEAMFSGLDKNKDGFLSKEEVKGTPHDKDFSSLDKDNDSKLSREEHAAAPEHAGKSQGAAGPSGPTGVPAADAKKK